MRIRGWQEWPNSALILLTCVACVCKNNHHQQLSAVVMEASFGYVTRVVVIAYICAGALK